MGVATTARLLLASERTPELKPTPSATSQTKIDAWLAGELKQGGKAFESNLNLASAAGSKDSNVSEIARFLLHRPARRFGWMHIWEPPDRDEAWYARMRTDPAVKTIVETFIRDVLPDTHYDFRRGFVAEAERVASELTPAFLAAAEKAVHHGCAHSQESIAEGALNDIAGFEAIIDTAVAVLTPTQTELQRNAEIRLAITNGEYSDDYADHLSENDDGWTAGEFIEAYVKRVRATMGWRHLTEHRHRDRLLYYWLRELAKEATPDRVETAEAFAVGHGSKDEDDLWYVSIKAGDAAYEPVLVDRVLEGHADSDIRLAALTCLAERAVKRLSGICQELDRRRQNGRLVEIAIDLGKMRCKRSRFDASRHGEAATTATELLPPLLQEISDAACALEMKATPLLSEGARELLARVDLPSEEVRFFRVTLDAHIPMFVPEDVRWLLANTQKASSAIGAMETAIRHDMATEIEAGLSHRFADVVALALKSVGMSLTAPLPERLLVLAKHKGSPVRKALVELLDAKPHSEHLRELLVLSKDDWSPYSSHGEEEDYPIAHAAIRAIGKLDALEEVVSNELFALAIDTRDSDLRFEIFTLLVRAANSRFQGKLYDLAVKPGHRTVSLSAASALVTGHEHIAPEIVTAITPELLATLHEGSASRLLLLVAARAEIDQVLKVAEGLSTIDKRRVLLLLAIWIARDRDPTAARRIARMLPVIMPA